MPPRISQRLPRASLAEHSLGAGAISMTASTTIFDKSRSRYGVVSVPHRMSAIAGNIVEQKRNLTPIKVIGAKTAMTDLHQGAIGNAARFTARFSKPLVTATVSTTQMVSTAAAAAAAPQPHGKVVLPPLIAAANNQRGAPQQTNTNNNNNNNKTNNNSTKTNTTNNQNNNTNQPTNSIYVCKGNNDQMIRAYFQKLKWNVLDQSLRFFSKFSLKWVECINDIDWQFFNPATQTVNHIQNISIIGTKSGLVQTVSDFESKDRALSSSFGGMHSSKFMPQTYRLDSTREELSSEEQAFMNAKNTGLWINKPTNYNCGKGINMVSDIKKFKEEFIRQKNLNSGKAKNGTQPNVKIPFHRKSIIQRYLEKPLLLDKRKFDMRVYVFIVSTSPLCVMFNPGYLRLSMNEYKLDNVDDVNQKYTHLTNAAIQKKHPDFATQKENTIWSVQKFHEYIKREQGVTEEQIETMQKKIKDIFVYVLRAAEKKIDKRPGQFELMGCDILLGHDLTPYLIEMNHNPALHLDTIVQSEVIPVVVRDAIDIALQVHSKTTDIATVLRDPNFDYKGFQPLINDATGFSFLRSPCYPLAPVAVTPAIQAAPATLNNSNGQRINTNTTNKQQNKIVSTSQLAASSLLNRKNTSNLGSVSSGESVTAGEITTSTTIATPSITQLQGEATTNQQSEQGIESQLQVDQKNIQLESGIIETDQSKKIEGADTNTEFKAETPKKAQVTQIDTQNSNKQRNTPLTNPTSAQADAQQTK